MRCTGASSKLRRESIRASALALLCEKLAGFLRIQSDLENGPFGIVGYWSELTSTPCPRYCSALVTFDSTSATREVGMPLRLRL